MNIATTDELVEAIAELRLLFPDWRMGQLVANLALAAGATEINGIWDVEDEHLIEAAHRLIDRNRGRALGDTDQLNSTDDGGINGTSSSTTQQPPREVS